MEHFGASNTNISIWEKHDTDLNYQGTCSLNAGVIDHVLAIVALKMTSLEVRGIDSVSLPTFFDRLRVAQVQ